MKFSYTPTRALDSQNRVLKRPLVEIELVGQRDRRIRTLGLIDSGADITMMNAEYAQALGIELDPTRTREYLGIGSSRAKCHISNVTIQVRHFDRAITSSVAFIDSPSVDILLGQEGFFDSFRVKFEKDHDSFELTLAPTAKN